VARIRTHSPRRRNLLIALASQAAAALLPASDFSEAAAIAPGLAGAKEFPVFDALLHMGKPESLTLGMRPIYPVARLWGAMDAQTGFSEQGVVAAVREIPASVRRIFFDIETWPLLDVAPIVRSQSIAHLERVLALTRELRPDLNVGFYAFPPVSTYWPLMLKDKIGYPAWQETNEQLAGLASRVDALYPSLYTFYDDRKGWLEVASGLVSAARHYGKPVYPFLWFEYHDSNPTLHNHEIAAAAWKEELDFCRSEADGVVLWGGYRERWNPQAAWWQSARQRLHLQIRA
jgi:hypothetical protein